MVHDLVQGFFAINSMRILLLLKLLSMSLIIAPQVIRLTLPIAVVEITIILINFLYITHKVKQLQI